MVSKHSAKTETALFPDSILQLCPLFNEMQGYTNNCKID
jgi:hypothetical protein